MAVDQTYEKMVRAVVVMATGLGGLRDRLAEAYVHGIMQIPPADVRPRESTWLLNEIAAQFTHPSAKDNDGSVKAILSHMTDNEAVDLAHKIMRLYSEVSLRYWQGRDH